MNVFISYVVLGLSLAAPIGPINAAQIDRGIKSGFLHSWLVGIGAMTADVLYMLLVYFVEVRFLHNPVIQICLWISGCFILVYTGVESLFGAAHIRVDSLRTADSAGKSFVTGFFMSLSNPLTILFWLGIYGSVLAETAAVYGDRQLILYSLAIVLGITVWDVAMALVSSSFRKFLTVRTLLGISVVSGLSLIAFGFYFGAQACRVLFS